MDSLTDLPGVGPQTAENLRAAGYRNPRALRSASPDALARVDGIGKSTAERIVGAVTFDSTGPFTVQSISGEGAEQFTDAELATDQGDTLLLEQFGRNDASARRARGGQMTLSIEPASGGRNARREIDSFGFVDDAIAASSELATGFGKAKEANQERSASERRTDSALKAPITTDFSKWNQNKDKYDYPGVDTP